MRVLVTGATGFLGNNLCRTLIQQGHQPVAAVRSVSDLRPLDGIAVETVTLDFESASDISVALDSVDAIVHSAAMIHLGWTKLDACRKVNVDNTIRIAQVARRKNIRMIFVSSVDALGMASPENIGTEDRLDPPKPPNNYVVTKREAETAFLLEVADGLDGIIVNPGFLIGPYDWKPSSGEMMLLIYNNFIFFVPGGGCSVVDVRDVAAGIASAIENGQTGQRYILAGENMSYFDLWDRMAKAMKCGGPKRKMRDGFAKVIGGVCDLFGKVTCKEFDLNSGMLQMGQLHHYYSSDKAIAELGYKINDVDDAIADAFDWFVANEYVKKK